MQYLRFHQILQYVYLVYDFQFWRRKNPVAWKFEVITYQIFNFLKIFFQFQNLKVVGFLPHSMLDTRFLTPTRFFEVANMLSLNSKILLLLSECTLGTAVCPALSNTFAPYDEKYGKIHELTQKILFLGYIYGKFSKNFAMQNLLSITHSYFKPLKMLEESLKEFMSLTRNPNHKG